MTINDFLISFGIGINFRSNFHIADNFGKIVDDILYDKKSFFNPKIFSQLLNEPGKIILHNGKRSTEIDKLIVDISNLIIKINFKDNENFNVKDM